MPQDDQKTASEVGRREAEAARIREVETQRAMAAMAPLADRWSFQVLREVFGGVRRYGELQRKLGISRNILADRLATLVEAELLERVRYRTDPDWYEYRMTQRAADLYPAIVIFYEWVFTYYGVGDLPDRPLRTCDCGAPSRPIVVCSACGKPTGIDPDEVVR